MSGLPIKVCLIAPLPPPYGGIAHWTAMIVRYFDRCQDVTITGMDTAPKWRAVYETGVVIRIVGGALQLSRDIGRLIGKLVTRRFDVAHLTTSGQLAVFRDIAFVHLTRCFGVNLVYHIRFGRVPAIALAKSFEWCLLRHVMSRASAVIAIDKETYSAVRDHAPEVKIELIPNCVDLARLPVPSESSRPSGNMIAMFIGWVIPSKGVTELVAAWSSVKREGWCLQIVGPGDERYISELRGHYTSETIEFVGELPHAEAMERLAKCDVLILPSHTEGFPNVVVEAMALGKPVIATDVGAIPEMLGEDAGIVVPAKDGDALACALEKAIGDPGFREKIGANASERARRLYALDVVAESYVRVWRKVSRKFQ
jgi:glycosyltransferase involved in cell wall biosynthesis